jgi:hypothetical protein
MFLGDPNQGCTATEPVSDFNLVSAEIAPHNKKDFFYL